MDIYDEKDNRLLLLRNDFNNKIFTLSNSTGKISCKIEKFPLSVGTYHCSIYLSILDKETLDFIENVNYFEVVGGDFFGNGKKGLPNNCKILFKSEWELME